MSMGLLLGTLNLLLEADFKNYFRRLSENRLLLFLLLFYGFFWLGLFWTQDLSAGFDLIRKQTSLLLIPLIIGLHAIPSKRSTKSLITLFLATLVLSSAINEVVYHFFPSAFHLIDIRDMSLFGSHIRYGILIGFGLGFCIERIRLHWIYGVLSLWFLYYTFDSQVLSGLITVAIVLFGTLFLWAYKRRQLVAFAGLISLLLFLVVGIGFYLAKPIHYREVCKPQTHELLAAWNKRSALKAPGLDMRQQQLQQTLERYLMSKSGCLNAQAVQQLSPDEISAIEHGVADVHEGNGGLVARLFGLRYQLHQATNPSDHSLLERLEYWRTAAALISKNWFIGVGTGDLDAEMQQQYRSEKSLLRLDRRLRPHNYYLTTWLTFGVFGFLLLVLLLVQFIRKQWIEQQWMGLLIGLTFCCTFFIEDSLETQMGITIFAFFYAFYSRRVQR
jgi:hypothetical protein